MAPIHDSRTSSDESEDSRMIKDESPTSTPQWAEKSNKTTKTAWWKYAAGAVLFVALMVPAVNLTSSIVLENRVASAVEAALAKQAKPSAEKQTSEKPSDKETGSSHNGAVPLLLSNGTTIMAGNPVAGQRFEIHDCGSNAEEARAKGCAYDVMMQEWTPPECIDWTLSEKFLKKGNWTWYSNFDMSTWMDDVEVAKGDHDVVYVAQSYHRHHCIFTWERTVRALRTGRPLIEKLVDYDHVMHCKMNTLRTYEEGAEPVKGVVAPTAFVKCASLDVWMENLPHNEHSSIERLLKLRDMAFEENES